MATTTYIAAEVRSGIQGMAINPAVSKRLMDLVERQDSADQIELTGTLAGATTAGLTDLGNTWNATVAGQANANFAAVQLAVNAIRTALVNSGIIKGSA